MVQLGSEESRYEDLFMKLLSFLTTKDYLDSTAGGGHSHSSQHHYWRSAEVELATGAAAGKVGDGAELCSSLVELEEYCLGIQCVQTRE